MNICKILIGINSTKCLGTKSLRQQMIVSENGKVIFMGFFAIVSGIDDKCKSTAGETKEK